jgi:hypothetical protein
MQRNLKPTKLHGITATPLKFKVDVPEADRLCFVEYLKDGWFVWFRSKYIRLTMDGELEYESLGVSLRNDEDDDPAYQSRTRFATADDAFTALAAALPRITAPEYKPRPFQPGEPRQSEVQRTMQVILTKHGYTIQGDNEHYTEPRPNGLNQRSYRSSDGQHQISVLPEGRWIHSCDGRRFRDGVSQHWLDQELLDAYLTTFHQRYPLR